MIKIYKVDSFEKFEYLLNILHERGAKWANGDLLDDEPMASMHWILSGCNGIAVYREGNKVMVSDIDDIEEEVRDYERKGDEYTIIEDVKLPKPKVSETHSKNDMGEYVIFSITDDHWWKPNKSDTVEQPSHYIGEHGLEVREIEENFLVRYQDGHLAHLAGALLEYLLRAPSKGKLTEDIKKVRYLANEMAEYVEKVSQE